MQSTVPTKLPSLIWLVSALSLVGGILAVGADPPQNCIATNPDPPDGAKYVVDDVALTWTPGCDAASHDVYLGTDQIAVDSADPASEGIYRGRHVVNSYDPCGLLEDTTYYWRIDGLEADGAKHTGQLWRFKTLPDIPNSDPNLVGWWRFDESQGATVIDWSGYDRHGSIVGDPQWVLGYDGGALVFDGTDYVEIVGFKGVTGSHPRTCAAWIKTDTSKDMAEIITWGRDQPGEKWAFYLNNGRLAVDVHDGYIVGEKNLRDGEWHHVAAALGEPIAVILGDNGVWSVGHTNLIINGILQSSGELMDIPVNTARSWNVRIGGQTDSSYFEGLIDDVRIYDRDVTEEIVRPPWARLAWNPRPPDRSKVDIERAVPLCWSPGDWAAQHDVYLGTDKYAVSGADTSDTTGIYRGRQEPNEYTPLGDIEWGDGPYYWRIDEVEADGTTIHRGRLWSFTVVNYLFVDDFESYDDYCNRIFYTWSDGWGHSGDAHCGVEAYGGNGTGSTVGHLWEPFAERTIVHEGRQSMPFEYVNDGSTGRALYSETERALDPPQDWTREGVKSLTLWFRGYPASVGSFSHDPITGIYAMTADGDDIGGLFDQFHYAYKRLSGKGEIVAKVLSVQNSHGWAKAGVMIREDLDPNSAHAMAFVTPGNGVVFDYRPEKGDDSVDAAGQQTGITAPHWVRITRNGNDFTAEHSADGTTWAPLGEPQNIPMDADVYVGLVVTSHNSDPTLACVATFSDVAMAGTVTGQWQSQDIGITSNVAEQLYLALEDSAGKIEVVKHPDPNAALCDTWQEWNIGLQDFDDAGVDLESIAKMYIGLGDRDDPEPGGSGLLYFDDIRLYRPRCVPWLAKPAADLSGDCLVDYADLRIMAEQWLLGALESAPNLYEDGTIDLKDYAVLGENWLEGFLLWP